MTDGGTVLVFEDDRIFADLILSLLREMGFEARHYSDGSRVLEHVRRERPRLVLLDVMMPGMEGISACRKLKSDPETSHVKVVIVTGKGYVEDKARAEWARADLFLTKPFDNEEFLEEIREVLSRPVRPPPTGRTLPPSSLWSADVWGCQDGPGCLSSRHGKALVVLDAGAGLGGLAASAEALRGAESIWVLLTHYHKDHTAGLKDIGVWLRQGREVHVAGPENLDTPLQRVVQQALAGAPQDQLARVRLHMLQGDCRLAEGLVLRTLHAMHPGPTLAFRLEAGERSLVFAPDSEVTFAQDGKLSDYAHKLLAFCKGADLLVHDARYSAADYPKFAGQGHSSVDAAVGVGARAGARRLLLYHVDGKYSPAERQTLLVQAHAAAQREKSAVQCLLAREGLKAPVG